MREIKLKPCPFCGSKIAPDIEEDMYHNFRVLCRLKAGGCGASTALCDKLIAAVKSWNRRTDSNG
jgi:Lar family restriction alleviation protein